MKRLITAGALLLLVLGAGACGNSTEAGAGDGAACVAATPDDEIPLAIGAAGDRVDLARPVFSDPTAIDNQFFPVGELEHAILLGTVDGEAFRAETTVLAGTGIVEWNGEEIEVLVSQYVAWSGRRVAELALDWYAQSADGAVWYLGEDVFNFEGGVVVDEDGTWVACEDGPGAMIMPANPQVGDVYRPENAYGIVFEEVTVTAVGGTVTSPRGTAVGAVVVRELHMDGTTEDKTFAAGYGEFYTGSGGDSEALALGLPIDALGGSAPPALANILDGTRMVAAAAAVGDWEGAESALDGIGAAWDAYGPSSQPPRLGGLFAGALVATAGAVAARDGETTRHEALGLELAALDFLARHRPLAEINFLRLDLWLRQLILDHEIADMAGVASDIAVLGIVLARVEHLLAPEETQRWRAGLAQLGKGAVATAETAAELRAVVESTGARHGFRR